jgi:hypothetical protein
MFSGMSHLRHLSHLQLQILDGLPGYVVDGYLLK